MTTKHDTREGWLLQAAAQMRDLVFTTEDLEFQVPEFRVSVGWPKGKRSTTAVIGECFNTANFEDKVPQIYISPVLEDPMEILGCLAHEMIHALDDCQNGHRGHFAYVFKRIGMAGKKTQCAVGEDLALVLKTIAESLGDYPHSKMGRGAGKRSGPKKQTSRMHKVACDCGYTIRVAKSWMDKGLPTCVCGSEMKEA
ncbi:MAG TPA: hypothetical protein VIQ27_16610 [Gemmatimonadales bacterium]|jgi:SprT-like family.